MRTLPVKLAVTGGVAALLVGLPVSIDVSRSNATASGHAGTISIGLNVTPLRQLSVDRQRLVAWRASRGGSAFCRMRACATASA